MATGITRRRLLQLAGGVTAGALIGCRTGTGDDVPTADPAASVTPIVERVRGYEDDRRWEGKTVLVASPGEERSEYLNAQVAAIFEPFQRLTGATLRTVRTDLDELRQQVNSAEVTWSICDVPSEDVLSLANSAIVDEIDYSIVDADALFDPLVMQHGTGANLYSTVMAYFHDEQGDGGLPASWSDFWDIGSFPGVRGFQESPIGTLEFALIANGTDLSNLYPLDVEAAFQYLDAILEHVVLWWRQGAQPTQMIAAGDLQMVAAWHDRIQSLATGGATVGMSWNQSQINGDSWVVPNGAPERDLAMDFINFATRPEVVAAFSQLFPFGPVNANAFDLLEPEQARRLPASPEIIDRQFTLDYDWWFKNREAVQVQFDEWLAAEPDST